MFQSFTLILTIAALFSYINYRWLKLPSTIGAALGWAGWRMIHSIQENAHLAILLTLAAAMGGYSLASLLHSLWPIGDGRSRTDHRKEYQWKRIFSRKPPLPRGAMGSTGRYFERRT